MLNYRIKSIKKTACVVISAVDKADNTLITSENCTKGNISNYQGGKISRMCHREGYVKTVPCFSACETA